ncbi:cannabinoid receptor 2-like [Oculina patagonica]
MNPNLTTNETPTVLPDLEMEQAGRPCFSSGISQTFQLHFFYYSNFVLTPVTFLLGLWCFLSNGLILIAILWGGLRIRPGFLLVCSLTLTDVVWGGLVTPVYVRLRVKELLTGKACAIRSDWDSSIMVASFFVCLFSTLGNLGVMSVDRYLAVAKPMWYKTTVTMQHAILACGGVWLTSVSMVILKQVEVFPRKALDFFEVCFIILFSCLVVAVQILTLVTLRKHNNAVAQVMEESARVNPATANNAIERQLTATTRHVVSLLALLIIPIAFLVGLSQILRVAINIFGEPLFFPIATLCSGINPVLYYRGNAQIRDGIAKLVKCQ